LNEEKNEIMKKLIINWDLPQGINENKETVIFKFDDNGLVDTNERGYHCENGDVKFCLYDKRNGKVLFSMDFYKSNPKIANLSGHKVGIKLELLNVHVESFRKKGIASYYLEKLKDYAIRERVDCINVMANANAENFKHDSKKNSLLQTELKEFYKKRSTQEMPIVLLG